MYDFTIAVKMAKRFAHNLVIIKKNAGSDAFPGFQYDLMI